MNQHPISTDDNKPRIVENLNAAEFALALEQEADAVLVDVRTDMEFSHGHIPNAIHIDIRSRDFVERVEEYGKDKNIYLYCQHGSRSFYAGIALLRMGFENVRHLDGGIVEWRGKVISNR